MCILYARTHYILDTHIHTELYVKFLYNIQTAGKIKFLFFTYMFETFKALNHLKVVSPLLLLSSICQLHDTVNLIRNKHALKYA